MQQQASAPRQLSKAAVGRQPHSKQAAWPTSGAEINPRQATRKPFHHRHHQVAQRLSAGNYHDVDVDDDYYYYEGERQKTTSSGSKSGHRHDQLWQPETTCLKPSASSPSPSLVSITHLNVKAQEQQSPVRHDYQERLKQEESGSERFENLKGEQNLDKQAKEAEHSVISFEVGSDQLEAAEDNADKLSRKESKLFTPTTSDRFEVEASKEESYEIRAHSSSQSSRRLLDREAEVETKP